MVTALRREALVALREGGWVTRCAWCGRYRIGDDWVTSSYSRGPVRRSRTTHSICEDCVAGLREAGQSA